MLDITILNDTLFPIFLFIIYFSLGCIAIHTQKDEKELDCKTTEDIISYSQILSPIFDEILEDLEETGTQEPEPMSKNPIPIPPQPENPDPQIREILKKLTKRDCRKICAPLKIQQTYKGKEINTNSMKNAVLEKFDSNSELVLQVLAKYLPELMAQKQAA